MPAKVTFGLMADRDDDVFMHTDANGCARGQQMQTHMTQKELMTLSGYGRAGLLKELRAHGIDPQRRRIAISELKSKWSELYDSIVLVQHNAA